MKSLSLKVLQQQFSECIRDQQVEHPALALIRSTALVSAATRMSVYQKGYWIRIVESFQEDFPRVLALLGDEKFEEAVRECLTESPSRSWSLAEVSGGFHKFISKKCRDWRLPFLGVLAEYEWHQLRISFTSAPAPFDVQKLANVDEDELDKILLHLNPTLFVMKAPWRLDIEKPKRAASLQSFIIYRAFDGVKTRRLSGFESRLLRFFSQSRSVTELTQYLERQRLKPELVSSMFGDLVQQQIIF